MVDRPQWQNEGNLARDWEQRLKPARVIYRRKRVQLNGRAKTVVWMAGMWAMGLVATFLAVQVILMGYRVDALQQSYNRLERQHQVYQEQVAKLTATSVLQGSASRLKVALAPPQTERVATVPPPVASSWSQRLGRWFALARKSFVGQ